MSAFDGAIVSKINGQQTLMCIIVRKSCPEVLFFSLLWRGAMTVTTDCDVLYKKPSNWSLPCGFDALPVAVGRLPVTAGWLPVTAGWLPVTVG